LLKQKVNNKVGVVKTPFKILYLKRKKEREKTKPEERRQKRILKQKER